jgi:SAM-dependent methyltransferase
MEDVFEQRRQSFGGVAAAYEAGRPVYAPAAIEWVLEAAPGRHVLDLAAGTGKLSRSLLAAGARITAVEPSADMLHELRAALPDVPALIGSAEEIPLPDASVDAVMVGQAFHWFTPERALPEIARVLRPGGVLGLLWNVRDDSVAWIAAVTATGAGSGDLVSQMTAGDEEKSLAKTGLFEPAETFRAPNPERYDADRLVQWAASTSTVAILEPEERGEVLAAIREIAVHHPDLAGKPTFDVPYETHALRARLAPGRPDVRSA